MTEMDSDFLKNKLLAGIHAQQSGDLQGAEAIYMEILTECPDQPDALHLLGTVAQATGQLEFAVSLIAAAIEQESNVSLYHHNLGVVYESLGQPELALVCYQESFRLDPSAYNSAFQASKLLINLRRHEEATPLLSQILKNLPQAGIPSAELNLYLAITHWEQGEHSIALNHLEKALEWDPSLEQARWFYHLYLPAIYQDEEELKNFRSRFTQHLNILIQSTPLETQEQCKTALDAASLGTNHYLQYQGYSDIELQQQYADFIQKIVVANSLRWSYSVPLQSSQPGDPLRIGFVSDSMRACSYSRLSLGWVKYLNRHLLPDQKRFRVYAYHLDSKTDFMTELYRQYADVFRHIPTGLESVVQQFAEDRLDVLVYLEIGLSPLILQLASLRLAPVQCSTWAHPVTSGLSTIDYFLSSDLMEPENGQDHYREQLVRLPHLGTCFEKPILPMQKQARADFGLREDAVVYLACQYLGKYLPQFDDLFAAIAKRVPNAQFVFLALPNTAIAEKFCQRLAKVFTSFDLNIHEHVLMLPRLDYQAYLDLNRCADVMLDSYGWSGGITTLEALTVGLPVVTCPGELMRGRHTYAMLKRMGLEVLIASDLTAFVDLAVQLGSDPDFRSRMATEIEQRRDLLFEDQACVTALGHFFEHVVLSRDPRK
ncbi:glycosyltransferase [Synechococcus sp. Nb3U1]|uniref:O-linked N-acetylglucosamine transferase, SPINDLY family protein n=1 Tax=Synechococcus sp. Nb3U1 TaxID=1914529 RepID=UPI001F2FC11E|nr:tetratricopeptide repeat protein [Synechococcus sp. Nb3U1]MCF2970577.1 glycosyltransferase [Synechococcus sp. Nb3U1]